MLVLALDAATYAGSVALLRDGSVVASQVVAMRGQDEERLMPAVAAILVHNGVTVANLSAVACGAGPGSFTSLRIAASIAKGIAEARRIPLMVAPSTLLVAAEFAGAPGGRLVVALDAMRGDFFCHDIQVGTGGTLHPGRSWRCPRSELEAHAAAIDARIVGPVEDSPIAPHARGFGVLLAGGLTREVDVATWEPDYGRKAEAQVKWEAAHGRELDA